MTLVELRKLAKERGIASVSGKKKPELIALLSAPVQSVPETAPKKRGRKPKAAPASAAAENAVSAQEPVAEELPKTSAESAPKAEEPAAAEESPERQNANGDRRFARTQRSYPNSHNSHSGSFQNRQQNGQRRFTHGEQRQRREEAGDPESNKAAISEMLQGSDCREAAGVLEIMEGYGFLRVSNYFSGPNDVYVSIAQIRRFNLKVGDYVEGRTRPRREGDKYEALLYIDRVNGLDPDENAQRPNYEDLTPIFPNERYTLETPGRLNDLSVRLIDLIAPIGKGQRAMIVSQPKAGKTTLLKQIANGISENYPETHLIVLLIDERPEEVTDMRRCIKGEVVASTFDELPEHHTRIAEMVQERAMRLVEQGRDVVILLDSLTRLTRAYNLVIPPTGRTLSGGMDPGALHRPKRFFGAARNIEGGGSLTVIATALVETGSRLDDIVYEEFKGTGNMEIHLDRRLSEKRIFPAIDIYKSGTRREDLLLTKQELEGVYMLRKVMAGGGGVSDVTESVIGMLSKTTNNEDFLIRLRDWIRIYEKQGYSASQQNRYGQ